jgi:type IV secretory pathway TrbL component
MGDDIAVVDRFLDIFSRYIDSGFGLIAGDVGFLVKVFIGIGAVLVALAWAAGEDEVLQAFARKVLCVGFFAFILKLERSGAGALAWVVTLVAFFVLAIMLFLAVVEFKLTTLKGFILVPFALWRGTSSIGSRCWARSSPRACASWSLRS